MHADCYCCTSMLLADNTTAHFHLLQGSIRHTKARQQCQLCCKMFTVLESCTEAWTDLSDDSANVDLSCQAYNGYPDALLLGNFDGVLDVAWITGGQASEEHQDLYRSMFLYTEYVPCYPVYLYTCILVYLYTCILVYYLYTLPYFCKQSCPDRMLTITFERQVINVA